jgi:WD40 repeat protein
MGEVYRAKDTRLDRDVAIKVLPEHFADDEERLRRFEREAKSLASLNHSNVAQIHGVDQVEDTWFLVLELVPGETLEERLAHGPLSVDEAIDVCRQIAEGLEAAHEAGVIHRDLKPANVRITPEGRVKVLDFGLAKPTRPRDGIDSSGDDVLATEEGRLLGTPTYMAPEQARGKPVDRRVDIWAFGCLLYECLSATRAFRGDTIADVLSAVIADEPDWTRLPSETPRHVRELLARCLEKEPGQRLRDIGDAGLMLFTSGAVTLDAAQAGKVRPLKTMLAVVALVAGALAAAVTSMVQSNGQGGSSAGVTHLAIPQPDRIWAGSGRGSSLSFAVSPDGQSIARWSVVPSARGGESVIVIWNRGTGATTVLSDLGPIVGDPVFSPDGKWIGYATESHLMRIATAGDKEPTSICRLPGESGDPGDLRGAAWLENGTIVFGINEGSLYGVAVDGGEVRPWTKLAAGDVSHCWPGAVAGTDAVVFTVARGGGFDLAVVRAGAESHEILREGAQFGRHLSPGHVVYLQGLELRADSFDTDTLRLGGSPVALDLSVNASTWSGKVSVAIALDGTLVYSRPAASISRGRTLAWVDGEGLERDAGFPPRAYSSLSLSPDGRRVLVALQPTADSNELWIGNTSDGRLTPFHESSGYWPVWDSADEVMYVDRSDHGLRRRSVAGDEPAESLGQTAVLPVAMKFDGSELLFAKQGRSTGFDLWRLTAGEEAAPLWREPGYQATASFSRDGAWLAFGSYLTAVPGLAVGSSLNVCSYPDVERERASIPISSIARPIISADGSEVFYEDGGRIMVATLTTSPELVIGAPQTFYNVPSMYTGGRRFDLDSEARRIIIIKEDPLISTRRPELFVVVNWGEAVRAACARE